MSIVFLARPTKAEFLNPLFCTIGVIGDPDCVAPTTPEPIYPTDGAYLTSNNFSLQWNASTDDRGTVTYDVCIATSSTFSGQTCRNNLTDTQLSVSDLVPNEAGTWYWRVIANDDAGNGSDWTAPQLFVIDVADPVATITTQAPVLVGGDTTIAVIDGKVGDENLARYSFVVTPQSDTANIVFSSGEDIAPGFDQAVALNWNIADPSRAESGIYTITLTATDRAGRTTTATIDIEVDNDGPTLIITGGDTIIKSGSISPSVTVEEIHGDVTFQWAPDPNNPAELIYDSTAKEPTFTPSVEGSYTFFLTGKDTLGNVSTESFEFGFKKDLPLVPEITDPSDPSEELVTNNPQLPAAVSPTTTPSRGADEEASDESNNPAAVLGSTISGSGDSPLSANVAALAPTTSGWSILGILWYWWLAMIAGVAAAWLLLKKFVINRASHNS